MKCQGYYPICQNKGDVIIIFGSGKDKYGFCKKCAIKYMETCTEKEKESIQNALLSHEAISKFTKKVTPSS